MTIPTFNEGDMVRIKVAVTDTTSGAAIDPSTLAIVYQVRSRSPITLTYGGGGTIVRDGLGLFHVDIDSTDQAGQWNVEAITTGIGQASAPAAFKVSELPITL